MQAVADLLADQAQLLVDRGVVVVAVDDDRVGQLEPRERGVTRLDDQLQLGATLGELGQPALRRGVDGGDPPASGAVRPREQLAREQAVLGPDLGNRARPRGLQAAEDHLAHVRERAVEAVQ